jgi:hypothetical protein
VGSGGRWGDGVRGGGVLGGGGRSSRDLTVTSVGSALSVTLNVSIVSDTSDNFDLSSVSAESVRSSVSVVMVLVAVVVVIGGPDTGPRTLGVRTGGGIWRLISGLPGIGLGVAGNGGNWPTNWSPNWSSDCRSSDRSSNCSSSTCWSPNRA